MNMDPFIYQELTEIAALLNEILNVLTELKEVKEYEDQ